MNNDFFKFVETYWDDIVAFFDALINFVKAAFDKISGSGDDETTTA